MTDINKRINELQQEIGRLKDRAFALENPPKKLEEPNLETLEELIDDYVKFFATDDHEDNDHNEYIFEAAVEAFYGPDFWKWFNRATE